jgi:nickel/cobalt transporter (NicO) family protein
MTLTALLLTAFVIGLVHALEPDHMVAVTTFVTRRPGARAAVGFGVRWGFGHALAVLIVGTILIAMGIQVPPGLEAGLETLVGVVLVGLGVWVLRKARTLTAHEHMDESGETHTHIHVHGDREHHRHGHALGMVGALHGLAGTGPVVALIPLALSDSRLAAGSYLAIFGIGTIVGMAIFALAVGWFYGETAQRSERVAQGLAVAVGLASVGVGAWWIFEAMGG